jgi:hypothetical protein
MEKNKLPGLQSENALKKMTFRIAKKKPKAKAYRVTLLFSVDRFHNTADELQQSELSVKEGYDEETYEEFEARIEDWQMTHAQYGIDRELFQYVQETFDLEDFLSGFMNHTIDSIEWTGDNTLSFMVYSAGDDQVSERELREELQNHPLEVEEYMSGLDNGWVTHTEITEMPYAYLDYRKNPILIEPIYEGGRKKQKTRKAKKHKQ